MFDHRLYWTDSQCLKHGGWLLLLVTALLYLPGTDVIPLMDRDEPRFAQATVEMMERGSWAVPYFNGEYRFDKPPLTYWWMQLHYLLFGVGEMGARLHGIVAVFLTALVTRGLAQRVSGSARTGFIAGLLWLTTAQVLIHGRLCVADMPMILCVTLACRSLIELVVMPLEKPRARWWWTLWLALGFGFLAKGPIAWFVPAMTIILWRFVIWKKPVSWKNLGVFRGLVLMTLPVAAWGIPALIETNGLFWEIGIGRHVVKRGVEVLNGRKFIPGYYLLSTWLSLFPWLFFAVPVWRLLRTQWSADKAFLAAWFVAPQIIFSFYATQLPHYVMPGYPAFLVLLSLVWSSAQQLPKLASWGLLTLGGVIFLVSLSTWAIPIALPELRSLVHSAAVLLTVMFTVGGGAALFAWKRNGMARWWMPLTAMVAFALALLDFSHQVRETSVTLQVSKILGAQTRETRLFSQGYDEPSLVFYTQHPWEMGVSAASLKKRLARPGPCCVVLLRREWALNGWIEFVLGRRPIYLPAKDRTTEVDAQCGAFPDMTRIVVEGFNGARSSWTEVVILFRRT